MDGAGDASKSRNTSDEEIEFSLTNKDVDDKQAKFLLCELDIAHDENSLSPSIKKIDRIMPKAIYGIKLGEVWKDELGEDWEVINQRFYGKLANAVLVGYAPSTNKHLSYTEKFNKHDGIGNSNNFTTKWVADNCDTWGLETIKNRTHWLRKEILKLYELPKAIRSDKIKDKYDRD
jgi:hypothetical protein